MDDPLTPFSIEVWITGAGANGDIRNSRYTELPMRMVDRRHPRPNQVPPAAPSAPRSTADIERMLEWVAAEVRAELRYGWYVSRTPARFIARSSPTRN